MEMQERDGEAARAIYVPGGDDGGWLLVRMHGRAAMFSPDGRAVTGGQVTVVQLVADALGLQSVSVVCDGVGEFVPAVLRVRFKQTGGECRVYEVPPFSGCPLCEAAPGRCLSGLQQPVSGEVVEASGADSPAQAAFAPRGRGDDGVVNELGRQQVVQLPLRALGAQPDHLSNVVGEPVGVRTYGKKNALALIIEALKILAVRVLLEPPYFVCMRLERAYLRLKRRHFKT